MFMYVMYVLVWACVCVHMYGCAHCVEARSWHHDDCLLYLLKPALLGSPGLANGASLAAQLISGIPALPPGFWECMGAGILTSVLTFAGQTPHPLS